MCFGQNYTKFDAAGHNNFVFIANKVGEILNDGWVVVGWRNGINGFWKYINNVDQGNLFIGRRLFKCILKLKPNFLLKQISLITRISTPHE